MAQSPAGALSADNSSGSLAMSIPIRRALI
jgi:hypothetical protein